MDVDPAQTMTMYRPGAVQGIITSESAPVVDRSQGFLNSNLIRPKDRAMLVADNPAGNAVGKLFMDSVQGGSTLTPDQFKNLNNKGQLLGVFSNPSMIPILQTPRSSDTPYAELFGKLTSDALTRGQTIQAGTAPPKWDNPDTPFIHHVYFPAIAYSGRTRSYVGAGFAMFYSNIEPPTRALGHTPDWRLLAVPGAGIQIMLDCALIGRNLNSVAAVLTSLATTVPLNGSYFYIVDCNTTADAFATDPIQIRGASLGFAAAAVVLHGAPVLYTGFLRKFPGTASISTAGSTSGTLGYDGRQLPGPMASNTDDIIEEVAGIDVKMAWAIQHDVPLVIPHKSSFNTNLLELVKRHAGQQMMQGLGQVAYSTTQSDMGLPYSSLKTPLLLATTLPEGIILASYAYLAFYWSVQRTVDRATSEANAGLISGGFSLLNTKRNAAEDRAERNKQQYQLDPERYISDQEAMRDQALTRTTKKILKERDTKVKKSKDRADAQRKKAAAAKAAKDARVPPKPSEKRVVFSSLLGSNTDLAQRPAGFGGGKKSKRARSNEPARRERSAPATSASQMPAPDESQGEGAGGAGSNEVPPSVRLANAGNIFLQALKDAKPGGVVMSNFLGVTQEAGTEAANEFRRIMADTRAGKMSPEAGDIALRNNLLFTKAKDLAPAAVDLYEDIVKGQREVLV